MSDILAYCYVGYRGADTLKANLAQGYPGTAVTLTGANWPSFWGPLCCGSLGGASTRYARAKPMRLVWS